MRGDELTPWLIRYAYEQGAFPMAEEDGEIEWYQPRVRALFPITGIHLSRSMRRLVRRTSTPQPPSPSASTNHLAQGEGGFRISFDEAFEPVMRSCLRPQDNWISEDIIRVFTEIHFEGWGHSCEVWEGEELVGGLYGIALGSCFCAESMFHRRTNASKIALWALVERCRERGFTIFDAQVMNPHLKSLGAYPAKHQAYMAMLSKAISAVVHL